MKNLDRFHPSCCYHVFNHAVGSEDLFRVSEDCISFLARFDRHLSPVLKVLSYCLMPNHFHFMVQIRDEAAILDQAKAKYSEQFDYHRFVMQRLSNFLNGYAKRYNHLYFRRGALFIDYTKRIEIKDRPSILKVSRYIHLNPVTHGFCESPADWFFSSYVPLMRNWPCIVDAKFVQTFFGSSEVFIAFHKTF